MKDEFMALKQNKTWDLKPRPDGVNPISYKWVYRVKQLPSGSMKDISPN